MKRLGPIFVLLLFFIVNHCKNGKPGASSLFTFLGDDNAPKIISAVPSMGDKGLPRTQKIAVLFSKPMNINSCVQSFSISPPTQGFYELSDFALTFIPSSQWNYGTYTYTLTKNCESKDGNDLKELFSASFTVGEATTAGSFPEISNILISAGTIAECDAGNAPQLNILSNTITTACMGAPNSNSLTLNFTRPMDRATTTGAISFSPSISASFVWQSDTTLTIIPDRPFASQARINIAVSTTAQDTQGIRMQVPVSGSFFVGTSNLLPTIANLSLNADTLSNCLAGTGALVDLLVTSVSNACLGNPTVTPIVFTFSRPMDQIQTQSNISFSPSFTGNFSWSVDSLTLTFTPDAKFNFGTRYTITLGSGAKAQDGIFVAGSLVYSFVAGGALTDAPFVQAIGVESQTCPATYPGVGNATGGDWLLGSCYWDSSLPVLSPTSYRFRGGDSGTGTGPNLSNSASCLDVNTDNFRLIFSNYMDLNATINAVKLRRQSPPSTFVQLSTWSWSDCQAVYPFGCRVLTVVFAELEASCNGTSSFGNVSTSGDFNLLQSNTNPAGFPFYMLTVDTSAKDVNGIPIKSTFNFSMEAK
ncbi:Ig-like domain-containing protein [Leptospira paudalimensis]|uniref:Ig-like domain-containing protein n=1 Tax=Leptospira paudalimensis TaxID=2950024 RepID=A0ABT3MDR5_9LEPT|nr:Ig-like domain-containing protein [Leptospira paudalimensis]MCW7506147.1 Ig-like domain-containing protein [Leptospira paudalimensis]